MTDEQQKWIGQLAKCSFLPGSWEKRFVHDLATFPPEKELTQRQAAALRRIAWRYRKQRGEPDMARPNDPLLLGPDRAAADYDALKAWNDGEPIR